MRQVIFSAIILVLVSLPVRVLSQSTQGTDFMLSFGTVQTGTPFAYVLIAASDTTTVTLTFNNITGAGRTVTTIIPAGELWRHEFTSIRTNVIATTSASNRTLEIHTDKPVSVYAMHSSSNDGDATLILPYTALGTEYYHIANTTSNRPDGYVVAAIENGTVVYRNGANPVTLNAGQSVFYSFSAADNTGTQITSNHPIAYFTAAQSVRIGTGASTIYEQLLATNLWGTFFIVPTVETNTRVRIVASQPNTTVTYWSNSTPTTTTIANAGGHIELTVTNTITSYWIETDKPVSVSSCLYSNPALAQIPPVQQAVSSIVVAPMPNSFITAHYAVVVAPTQNKNSTTMAIGANAATSLTGGAWITGAGNGNYSYYVVPLANLTSSYVFSNNAGVIVWIYGTTSNNAYYYVGGAATRDLKQEISFDGVGNLDGETFCFDLLIQIQAHLMIPLDAQPGHLKWLLNGVELFSCRDSMEWVLPFLPNGVYTVELVMRHALGYYDTLSATFTQDCPPSIAFPDSVTITTCVASIDVLQNDSLGMCSFSTIAETVTVPPASGGTAYFDVNKQLIYTPPLNFTGMDSLEYMIMCGDSTSTAKVFIDVHTILPTVSITSTTSFCVGTSIQLSPQTGGTWSSSSPSIATVTNDGLATGIAPGAVTFTYTDTTTACSNTLYTAVIAYPVIASISDTIVCQGEIVQFSCSTLGGVWSLSNANAEFVGGTSPNPTTIETIASGTTIVSYTVGTECPATVNATLQIRPHVRPQIKIGAKVK